MLPQSAIKGVPPEIGSAQHNTTHGSRSTSGCAWPFARKTRTKRREADLEGVRADLARRAALALTIPPGSGMGAAGHK